MVVGAAAVVVAVGCGTMSAMTADRKFADGELPVPADYRSWPKVLAEVQRPDAKQVRDIYMNPTGHKVRAGEAFPSGTVSIMDIYKARENADGTLMRGADGKLVKGELLRVFVMAKGVGWGESVKPAELRTGDWVYSAFLADGKTAAPDQPGTCRACHLPLASKDFFARYDEFFKARSSY
jgi:hemoglobin